MRILKYAAGFSRVSEKPWFNAKTNDFNQQWCAEQLLLVEIHNTQFFAESYVKLITKIFCLKLIELMPISHFVRKFSRSFIEYVPEQE